MAKYVLMVDADGSGGELIIKVLTDCTFLGSHSQLDLPLPQLPTERCQLPGVRYEQEREQAVPKQVPLGLKLPSGLIDLVPPTLGR